jgi:hypothetical protein
MRRLEQDVLPLAVELGGEEAHPRGVAAGTCQRTDQPRPDHVLGDGNDRNSRRRQLGGANGRVPAAQDDIDLGVDQPPREISKLLGAQSIAIGLEILTQHKPEPPQLVKKRHIMGSVASTGDQCAEAVRPARLLRPRCERPAEHAEDERNAAHGRAPRDHAITSSAHVPMPPSVLRTTIRSRASSVCIAPLKLWDAAV